jgi:hypothetical protein
MDSLIGNVPDNWTQARLAEVCDILAGPSGARLSLETRTLSNVPVVAPKDLRNNRIAEDGGAAVSFELANELSRYRLVPGDVVCARTGELGRQALAGNRPLRKGRAAMSLMVPMCSGAPGDGSGGWSTGLAAAPGDPAGWSLRR